MVRCTISPATGDLAAGRWDWPEWVNGEGKGLPIGPTTCWRTFSHRTMTEHDDPEQRVDHSRRKYRSVARCLSPEQTPVCWGRSLEFKDILDDPYLSFPPSLFGLGKGIRRLV